MAADLDGLRAAAAVLAESDPASLPPTVLAERVVELRRLIDGLEGTWCELVATLDSSGGTEGGTAAFLRAECRLAPAAARSQVVLSRRLAERPEVAGALSDGAISIEHARLMTRALGELAAVDLRLAADTEAPMLAAARRLDPSRLRREIAHARHALVPEAAASADEAAHRRRHLDVATTFDGMVAVSGTLDPEGGEVLLTALAALSGRVGPEDERTPGQRRADALTELCHRQLDRAKLPSLAGERPHLTVLVPLSALARRGAATMSPTAGPLAASKADATGTGAPTGADASGRAAAWGAAEGADSLWGAVLAPEAVRRLACDASLTRVVLAPDSQPLDVGRRTRVVPPAVRTALVVRDRGCTYPGCDRGPQWTDAHHVRHWADGGATSLDNLVLLCRRHHRTVHQGRSRLAHAPPRAA